MIYVILSAEIINKDPSNLGLILKIGYCRDDREKVRTASYMKTEAVGIIPQKYDD